MDFFRVENLTKAFGGLQAVHEMDLAVERGEIRSIIGPNGAGKTTLFNLVTGIIQPDRGTILFKGENITRLPTAWIVRRGIARSFQITSIFPQLTVLENLQISSRRHLPERQADDRAREVLQQIGLDDKAQIMAGHLSHGDQRHLDIGIALATNPELLLLDEPTSGMPPHETARTVEMIRRLRAEQGYTILLIEHKMDVVLSVSDRITVMHMGSKIAEGTPGELAENPEVRDAYLGGLTGARLDLAPQRPERPPAQRPPLLVLEGVNTYYGLSHALHDVSLTVREGEIVALLGRNGAGKTTTLRTIMGVTPPKTGQVMLDGQSLVGLAPEAIAKKGIGLVPQGRRIFANLNVEENLRLPFFMDTVPRREQQEAIDRIFTTFPNLKARRFQKGNKLSGGEQQMLAIGRALMGGRKRLLMLDEPSQGLAPLVVRQLAEFILEIRRRGITVLLVEQNVQLALAVADRVYILEDGRIVYEGGSAELRERPDVMSQYLVL